MCSKIKTIGVLTSGGDAPGMNAALRSVVRTALFNGITVKGIYEGYEGLLNKHCKDLDLRSVSGILELGGTMLYSARSKYFKTEAGVELAKKNCEALGIDGLIVIGGDGSFRGARDLSIAGVPCIGIPGTIDNDIPSTDHSIGFDTAVNTVVQNIDKLRDTSESHNRCSVVEVMGRHCGDIALHAAICSGAVSVLIPEIPYELQRDIYKKMEHTLDLGKKHFIVIVAEGVTESVLGDDGVNVFELAKDIEAATKVESRANVIGHVQRGGSPSAYDRVLASRLGHYAVELIKQGIGNRVVGLRQDKMVDYDILEALQMKRKVDNELVRIANEISI